jgi:hypothetical protein
MKNVIFIWPCDTIANMQDIIKIWFRDAIYLVTNTSNNMISTWSWENIDLMIIFIFYKKGTIWNKIWSRHNIDMVTNMKEIIKIWSWETIGLIVTKNISTINRYSIIDCNYVFGCNPMGECRLKSQTVSDCCTTDDYNAMRINYEDMHNIFSREFLFFFLKGVVSVQYYVQRVHLYYFPMIVWLATLSVICNEQRR